MKPLSSRSFPGFLLTILTMVLCAITLADVADAAMYTGYEEQTTSGQDFTFTFPPPPVSNFIGTDGTFTIRARGDYDSIVSNESLTWDIDGIVSDRAGPYYGATIIQTYGPDDILWEQSFTISGGDMFNITLDSSITIYLDLDPRVDVYGPSFVEFELTYETGNIRIEPYEGLTSSGNKWGPFTPACKTYTLTNLSPNSLDWTATNTQPWLDVTPGGGTLAGGASTTVDVCINAGANMLSYGIYTDAVMFSDLTGGTVQTRHVKLRVVSPEFKLTASDGADDDRFGNAVSISGDRCIVGAYNDNDMGNNSGSAYIFEWNGTNWIEQAKLTASDGADSDCFGSKVSINGDRCVIGVWSDDDKGYNSGSAYIFEWNDANWIEQTKLTASDGTEWDYFGSSVVISDNRCFVGASNDDWNREGSGSVYVFEWDGTNWNQQTKLTASDAGYDDLFGCSVDVSGDRCVIGAYNDNDMGNNSGSAYIFEWNGTNWIEQAKLTAFDGDSSHNFGCSVGISGDRCVIGALDDDDNGFGSGSVYIFEPNGTNWSLQTKLTALDGVAGDNFGCSVSISGDRCVIGARYDDDNGSQSGSAYIFEWNGTNWIQRDKLTASDGASVDQFGCSVSISIDSYIVGAVFDDDIGSQSGSAYVYGRPCIVDFHHFAQFAQYWLETGTGLPADLYEDNFVDLLDLEMFVDEWLYYCPTDWPLK
jgi:hypothetical protein